MGIFSRKNKDEKEVVSKSTKADFAKNKDNGKKQSAKAPTKTSMRDLYGSAGPAESSTAQDGRKKKEERKYASAYSVLVKPLVTEKAANLGTFNKYVFAVKREANKIEIAKAISEVYGIKPININIIKISGKSVRFGRTLGRRKSWKKAIVTLPKGKSINIYEGV